MAVLSCKELLMMLYKRILAGLIGAPLVLLTVWYGGWYFFSLLLILSHFAVSEVFRLTGMTDRLFKNIGFAGNVGLMLVMFRFGLPEYFTALVIYFLLINSFWVIKFPRPLYTISSVMWSSLYIPTLLGFFLLLRGLENGFQMVLMVLLTVWTADIAAYFCGTAWGKRKLAPQVSPKKSQEGAIGAVLASAVLLVIFAPYFGFGRPVGLLLGVVLSIAGIFGDLAESALKRGAQAKESGVFLPGHGGVLDRLDSLLFAAPVAYLLLMLISGIRM
jgi:phosphatidate cytidylyltransferase